MPASSSRTEDQLDGEQAGTSSAGDDSDFSWSCCTASVVGCVYFATMYRSLGGGDSGDLVSASCVLGVAHPPGYPLHTLLGALFLRLLPWGTPAWRVNMVSVFCGALASAQVFRASTLLLRERHGVAAGTIPDTRPSQSDAAACRWLSALGAFVFAFSPTVWMYSTHAEVFALNNLLVATLLHLAFKHSHFASISSSTARPSSKPADADAARASAAARRADVVAVAGAFVIGLGISNQHSFVLSGVPAVLLAVIKSHGSLLRPAMFSKLVLAGLAGLTPYVYMVWASVDPPSSSWGEAHTLSGFLHHFLRRDYGTFTVLPGAVNPPSFWRYLREYTRHELAQTPGGWGLWCILIGFLVSVLPGTDRGRVRGEGENGVKERESVTLGGLKESVTMGRLAAIVLSVYLVVFHVMCNIPVHTSMHLGVLRRFWIQPHVVASVFVAPGAREVFRRLGAWRRQSVGSERSFASHRLGLNVDCVVGAVVVALVAVQVKTHYERQDRSQIDVIDRYGRGFLVGMPVNATLLVQEDLSVHAIRYLQDCEGVRPDVVFLDQIMMTFAWYPRQQAKRLASIGITLPRPSQLIADTSSFKSLVPEGYTLSEFLEVNMRGIESRTFFECGGWATTGNNGEDGVPGFEQKRPHVGLCRWVLRNGAKFDADKYVKMAVEARRGLDWALPAHGKFSNEEWENHVATRVWSGREQLGIGMLDVWYDFKHRTALQEAVKEYRSIAASCDRPEMPSRVWRELGAALNYEADMLKTDGLHEQSLGMQGESLEAFRRYLELTPELPMDDVVRRHVKEKEAELAN